jgi:hypothetical protein
MDSFERLQEKFRKLDVNRILREVWRNPIVQQKITELNTKNQLFEKGEDSKGETLGIYTPFTIQIKVEKGQRIDHITLLDTGEFYESFKVVPLLRGFRIEANPDKGGGDNLFDDFGENIVGLSEESLLILCTFIQPFFTEAAKKALS